MNDFTLFLACFNQQQINYYMKQIEIYKYIINYKGSRMDAFYSASEKFFYHVENIKRIFYKIHKNINNQC